MKHTVLLLLIAFAVSQIVKLSAESYRYHKNLPNCELAKKVVHDMMVQDSIFNANLTAEAKAKGTIAIAPRFDGDYITLLDNACNHY